MSGRFQAPPANQHPRDAGGSGRAAYLSATVAISLAASLMASLAATMAASLAASLAASWVACWSASLLAARPAGADLCMRSAAVLAAVRHALE